MFHFYMLSLKIFSLYNHENINTCINNVFVLTAKKKLNLYMYFNALNHDTKYNLQYNRTYHVHSLDTRLITQCIT